MSLSPCRESRNFLPTDMSVPSASLVYLEVEFPISSLALSFLSVDIRSSILSKTIDKAFFLVRGEVRDNSKESPYSNEGYLMSFG